MTIGDKAKAFLGAIIIALVTWFASWIKSKFGVTVPAEHVGLFADWISNLVVSAIFGAIGGWAIWAMPNKPAA